MATLQSPGVQVQVIDESFYTPSAPGTVPLIFVATAQDKNNASATGIAQGTTAANAGKIWVITSQRDLTDTFGTPRFYTDTIGNPIHGGELNEYGLQTAYSVLGVSSRAYVVRANIDLAQLEPAASVPTGQPVSGTYWVDTANSMFGIFEWNASGTGSFVAKTPLVIDNSNVSKFAELNGIEYEPIESFGNQGDYAMVVTSNNTNSLWYKTSSNAWVKVSAGFDGGKQLVISPHYQYPTFNTSTPTGSVWIKTTTASKGANWVVKYFNGATSSWNTVSAPLYQSTQEAIKALDFTGGGKNIPVGTLFVDINRGNVGGFDEYADFVLQRRNATGPTVTSFETNEIKISDPTSISVRVTDANSAGWSDTYTVSVSGSTTVNYAQLLAAAFSAAGIPNIKTSYDPESRVFTLTHERGGEIEITDDLERGSLSEIGFAIYNPVTKTGSPNVYAAPAGDGFEYIVSNWKPLVYEAKPTAPSTVPADGRRWFDSKFDTDIMYHNGITWVGYRDSTAFPDTDPNGPIVSATEPTTQSDGTDLVNGDIWVSTADPERYGKDIYVFDSNTLKWVLQDTADQDTPNGWLFADARWATSGTDTAPATIKSLLLSNYLDPDAPDPALYPRGMRLWNLRRSGNNIKEYRKNYINVTANNGINIRFNSDPMANYAKDRWVTVSSNNEDGSGTFGRWAQRKVVTAALKSLVDANLALRDTDTLVFNLIATPGYPELIQNMIALNVDRGQTAFIVGDTPFRLPANGTALTNWGMNTALAYDNSDTGATSYDEYMGMFYPSGFTTDNSGNNIVVPPSHMMLRTIINSDAKSYQWFAPAGTRRGGVDNASSVGYIDAASGEFKTVALYEGLRNVLDDVKINPIATLPGVGIVNFGQRTRARNDSALDRINVVRLVAYLRRQLSILAKPYLFEPNDEQTRREIKAAADSLLLELVGQRALYDFIVVCDSSNNTPARIDRSELWMDIAIEPVKAVEFIYIPLRIKNTGEIAAGV